MADTEILGVCILNDDVNKFNMSGSDDFTMRKCGGILVLYPQRTKEQKWVSFRLYDPGHRYLGVCSFVQ